MAFRPAVFAAICVLGIFLQNVGGTTDPDFGGNHFGCVCQQHQSLERESTCPPDFKYNEKLQTCYKLFTRAVSWTIAEQSCQDLGPNIDLAVVDTTDKLNYFSYLLMAHFHSTGLNGTLWVGGLQEPGEGKWLWRTGQEIPLGSPLWSPEQPNNHGGNQDCVGIKGRSTWRVEDFPCQDIYGYLCEYQMNCQRVRPLG